MNVKREAEDFVETQGILFLGHILHRIQDRLAKAFDVWNSEIGIAAPTRTHSLMRAIETCPLSVTEIAAKLHQSHPLVITWITLLADAGLIQSTKSHEDGRKHLIRLTAKGRADLARQKAAAPVTVAAYEALLADANAPIFEALWRVEKCLVDRSFLLRLRAANQEALDSDAIPRR